MRERSVTIDGVHHDVCPQFFVAATQNPIEQHGAYPLPEAQLDRFAFKLLIEFPDEAAEMEILRRHASTPIDMTLRTQDIQKVAGAEMLAAGRALADGILLSEDLLRYILTLIRATRTDPDVAHGASTRAADTLVAAVRAAAAVHVAGGDGGGGAGGGGLAVWCGPGVAATVEDVTAVAVVVVVVGPLVDSFVVAVGVVNGVVRIVMDVVAVGVLNGVVRIVMDVVAVGVVDVVIAIVDVGLQVGLRRAPLPLGLGLGDAAFSLLFAAVYSSARFNQSSVLVSAGGQLPRRRGRVDDDVGPSDKLIVDSIVVAVGVVDVVVLIIVRAVVMIIVIVSAVAVIVVDVDDVHLIDVGVELHVGL